MSNPTKKSAAEIAAADKALQRIEENTARDMRRYIRVAQKDIERQLGPLYRTAIEEVANKSDAFRLARATVINDQLTTAYRLLDDPGQDVMRNSLERMVYRSREFGFGSAASVLNNFEPGLGEQMLRSSSAIRLEPLEMISKNASTRLSRHSRETVEKIKDVVASGLIRGESYTKTARELRRQTGLLQYQAERIVRTESQQASDEARRAGYKRAGVFYVQRIATQDERICEYCAERAGQVFEIDKAPSVIHPNDRCYNLPWKPEWAEEGLIDEEWWAEHDSKVRDKLDAQGKKPNRGVAPLERMANNERPNAVWSPASGYTDYGLALMNSTPKTAIPDVNSFPEFNPTTNFYVQDQLYGARSAGWNNHPNPEVPKWLNNYTHKWDGRINSYLRKNERPDSDPDWANYTRDDVREGIKWLDVATQEGRLAEDTWLYRGYGNNDMAKWIDKPQDLVGTVLRDPAFQSTSRDFEVAHGFVMSSKDEARVYMKIRGRKGKKAAPIEEISRYQDEYEVILPRDTKYLVVDVKKEVITSYRGKYTRFDIEVEILED